MEVLCIGNSFSCDATRYLHRIARASGVKINTTNLYIGGCSLERHYRNMLSGERAYELYYNGEGTGFRVSIAEALCNRKWDVVTLQQCSPNSFQAETFQPYASALAETVRRYAPKAKLLIHQTWAYEDGSAKLLETAGLPTSKVMLDGIRKAYDQIAQEVNADGLIPSGQLFGMMLDRNLGPIHRDTFHASLGLGRAALALLWYRFLTGNSAAENTFCDFDVPVDPDDLAAVKACVDELV